MMTYAKSDYVRQILSDGAVTDMEIQDARAHAITCLSQAGITASYEPNGYGDTNLTITGSLSITQQEAMGACMDQWIGPVEQLYYETTRNPQRQNWDDLVANCLVRKGLAPDGFTGEDYQNLSEQNTTTVTGTLDPAQIGPGGISQEATDLPLPAAVLPGGVPMDDPNVIGCMTDPLHA